nr:hypothetical protein [Leisingera aquimarina]
MAARQVNAALSAMRNKTDKTDARGIAQVLRSRWFNPVHMKSREAHAVRALLSSRKAIPGVGPISALTFKAAVDDPGATLLWLCSTFNQCSGSNGPMHAVSKPTLRCWLSTRSRRRQRMTYRHRLVLCPKCSASGQRTTGDRLEWNNH